MSLRERMSLKRYPMIVALRILLLLLCLLIFFISVEQIFPGSLPQGKERQEFLDGCRHVYLDMGTNAGVQIRKLYQPNLFPNASVLPIFDKFFGPIETRDLKTICAVGFEPNPYHHETLMQLEKHYQDCGWRVYINLETGVGKEEKMVPYVHKKQWACPGRDMGCNPGEAMYDKKGVMGRFTDNGNDGNYTADIDIGTLVQVRQIRIADFIKEVVASRRFENNPASSTQYPPSVVMKLDVEGRDLDVVPDLVMSGALQHIDHLGVDWTRDNYTDVALVNELSSAMETLSRFGKDRRLLRTTEVVYLEDESYTYFEVPNPYCIR